MIKITVYILCIYILLLAVIPCADIHFCGDAELVGCEHVQTDSHRMDCQSDLCSPLCACNCCMAAIAQIKPVKVDWNELMFQKENLCFYQFSITCQSVMSIWQPPRAV